MKKPILFACFPLVILILLLAACGENESNEPTEDEILPDTTINEGMVMTEDGVYESGLKFAPIGGLLNTVTQASLENLEHDIYQEAILTDTLISGNGYLWRGKRILLKDGGEILLEGNPISQTLAEEEIQYMMEQSHITRMKIESPALTTQHNLKVGSLISEFEQVHHDSLWYVNISYQKNYGLFGIVSLQNQRIIYFVKDDQSVAIPEDEESISLRAFPANTQVEKIVVLEG